MKGFLKVEAFELIFEEWWGRPSQVAQTGKGAACIIGGPGAILVLGRSPGIGTHSSILASRIPWTEEPGGLESIGSQRVGHD